MKEITYSTQNKRELIEMGTYKKYVYYILNLGTHPTAYVEIPKEHKLYGVSMRELDLDVHGGISYSNDQLFISNELAPLESWFIGWDYAHVGDYCGYEEKFPQDMRSQGKKWTVEEIIEDVKKLIEQIQ